jgi:hypothetical protein
MPCEKIPGETDELSPLGMHGFFLPAVQDFFISDWALSATQNKEAEGMNETPAALCHFLSIENWLL